MPKPLINYFSTRSDIAADVLQLVRQTQPFDRMIDPFCGSATLTFSAQQTQLAEHYFINDAWPIIKMLWSSIQQTPDSFKEHYSNLVQPYQKMTDENEKRAYYEQTQYAYNTSTEDQVLQAARFVFVINHAANYGAPIVNSDNQLCCTPDLTIQEDVIAIHALVDQAHEHLRFCVISDQSFLANLQSLNPTSRDLVILDPPYPQNQIVAKEWLGQPEGNKIYSNPISTDQLHDELRLALQILNTSKTPFVMLYGNFGFSGYEKYLLNEETLELQHMVRLSDDSNYIEHLYLSSNITISQMPKRMVAYSEVNGLTTEEAKSYITKTLTNQAPISGYAGTAFASSSNTTNTPTPSSGDIAVKTLGI